jgi:hypothetical protein
MVGPRSEVKQPEPRSPCSPSLYCSTLLSYSVPRQCFPYSILSAAPSLSLSPLSPSTLPPLPLTFFLLRIFSFAGLCLHSPLFAWLTSYPSDLSFLYLLWRILPKILVLCPECSSTLFFILFVHSSLPTTF